MDHKQRMFRQNSCNASEMSLVVDLNLDCQEEAHEPRGEVDLPFSGGSVGNPNIPVEESDISGSQHKQIKEVVTLSKTGVGMDVDTHTLIPKKRAKDNLEEKEGEFYLSDLVWGKVRSHPWWPGQIMDPSAASEKSMKHFKKDSYLIAYFGDETFAWNEPSKLRPFRMYFSEMKEQSNVETFCHALDCALNEISRRVEFGLACQCLPEDMLTKLKFQVLINTGIQDTPTHLYGGDSFSTASCFSPEKFMNYIKALAESPRSNYDVLEFVPARAQFLAFNRFKGHYQLPVFEEVSGDLGNDADIHGSSKEDVRKRKLSSRGSSNELNKKKRQRLMSGSNSSCPDTESDHQDEAGSKAINANRKKRKVIGSVSNERKRKFGRRGSQKVVVKHDGKFVDASDSGDPSLTSKNFHMGKTSFEECPPVSDILWKLCVAAASPHESYCSLKSIAGILGDFRNSISLENDKFKEETVSSGEIKENLSKATEEYPPMSEILLKLCSAAASPLKCHRSLTSIARILNNFRNSISVENSKSKEVTISLSKIKEKLSKRSEAPEYAGTEDSYWTDRIIQRYSGEELFGPETAAKKVIPVSEPKALENVIEVLDDKDEANATKVDMGNTMLSANENSDEYSPTTLILNFSDLEAIPSIPNLNQIFDRFGPLEESRTTILMKSKRVKLVFKRRSDAECAFSRAGKFSIFGPSLVSYRLKYDPSISSSTKPLISRTRRRRHQQKSSKKEVS